MKKIKDIKIFHIIPVLIVLLTSLTACGPRFYKNINNIETSYKEWVKEIGLFSHRGIKVSSYEEEDNRVEIYIEYDNNAVACEELRDIVNAHNKFVDENPDYFSSDIKIEIFNLLATGEVVATLKNFSSDDADLEGLNVKCSAKIQRMYICVPSFFSSELDVKFDIPVAIVVCEYFPDDKDYGFLKKIINPEQVVLYFRGVDFDREKVCKNIRENFPNVEIYELVPDVKGDRLERLR